MTKIEIERAGRGARLAIGNMMQLYMHDFSDFMRGGDDDDLHEDGRFSGYGPLDSYWRERDRMALLIRRAGRPIGFALVNGHTHSGLPADWNMAEFFIVRGHRRSGAGAAAADRIFSALPGQWELAVLRANTGAMAFWPSAIVGSPAAGAAERIDPGGPDWDGPVFRFHVEPGGAPFS
jgi:predicted acetyltransferase